VASCTQVDGSVQAFLDGELTAAEQVQVEQHLSECDACAGALRRQRATVAILFESMSKNRLDRDLSVSVMAHLPEMDHAALVGRQVTARAKQPATPWMRFARLMPALAPLLLVVLGVTIFAFWPESALEAALPVGMVTQVTGEALQSEDVSTSRHTVRLEDHVAPGTRFETAHGARMLVTLAGPSDVKLAPGTRMMVHDERHISVARGAVWLDVCKEDRYFRVTTPSGDVTVFGTVFGVEVMNDRTVVTVAEGTVQVENDVALTVLEPGDQVSVGLGEKPLVPYDVDAKVVLAWAADVMADATAAEHFARVEAARPSKQLRAEQVFVVTTHNHAVKTIRLTWEPSTETPASRGYHVYVYDAMMKPLFKQRLDAEQFKNVEEPWYELTVPAGVAVEETPILHIKVVPEGDAAGRSTTFVEVTASGA
jgi:anti-sigma factor RsiW